MGANDDKSRTRPGPISFSSERQVTSLKVERPANPGGMGDASEPVKQSPRGSSTMRIAGPGVWAVVGGVLVLVGIVLAFSSWRLNPAARLFTWLLLVAGLATIFLAWTVNRRNLTEARLRAESRQEENR
jgi:hypothetical protein